jgi:uncharacterized protein YegL
MELNDKVTHIAIILDESGSMEKIKKETIEGLKEQIQTIKTQAKENKKVNVSFITFSDKSLILDEDNSQNINELFFEEPVSIELMDEINTDSYQPHGGTPMLDAVGYTINKLKRTTNYENPNHRYLIMIMSDGIENASKEFDYETIVKMISELEDTERFTFTYMGPMNELDTVKNKLEISDGNLMGYEVTKTGTTKALSTASVSTTRYMEVDEMTTDNFYESEDNEDFQNE